MSLYIFQPRRPDGASDGFATSYLSDDRAASAEALRILDRHPRASEILIDCGVRRVGVQTRVDPEQQAPRGRTSLRRPGRDASEGAAQPA
jgi:hypothetical protein